MVQHIGAACTPLVAKGDHVDIGQPVGDGQGLCAPVHASVSGTVKAVEAMAANEDGSVFWVMEEAHPGYVGMDESKLKSAWTTGLKNAGLSTHTNENSFALVPRYVVGGGTAALVTDEPEITWTVDGVADAASTDFTVLYVDASRTAKQVTDVRKDNGTLAFSAQSQTALYLVAWKEIQDVTIKVELRNNTTTRYTNVFLYGHSLTAYITVEKGSTSLPYPGGTVELYLGDPNADGSMKLGEGTLSSICHADESDYDYG